MSELAKYCTRCAAFYDESAQFCGRCGGMLVPGPQAHRQRKGLGRALGAAVVIAVVLGGLVLLRNANATHDITGSITVVADPSDAFGSGYSSSRYQTGTSCDGGDVSLGYADMNPGADVVVKDDAGDVIATGSLETGRWTSSGNCELPISVRDVPSADFYSIMVGSDRRGEKNYSRAELEDKGWEVTLSLGP